MIKVKLTTKVGTYIIDINNNIVNKLNSMDSFNFIYNGKDITLFKGMLETCKVEIV